MGAWPGLELFRKSLSYENPVHGAKESGNGCENSRPARPKVLKGPFGIPDIIEQNKRNPLGHERKIHRVTNGGQALLVKLPKLRRLALQGRPAEKEEIRVLSLFEKVPVFILGQEVPAVSDDFRQTRKKLELKWANAR